MLTNKSVEAATRKAKLLGSEVWITEDGARGEGRLRLRVSPYGHTSYFFRYSLNGKQHQLRIHKEGLAEARAERDRLSKLYRDGNTDLHLFTAMEAMAAQARLAAEAAQLEVMRREAEAKARQGTFGQLLNAYTDDLERRGKGSVKDVRGAFRLDVIGAFPELASKPAKEVAVSDITAILRHCRVRPVAYKGRGSRLTLASATNGKLRQTAKLRSYLAAAFSFGLTADNDSQQDVGTAVFGLSANPVLGTKAIEGADRAETWALTKDELKAVLLAIEDLPERHRSIAKAMLYLAGQRVEMLCRLTWPDMYEDAEHGPVMQLLDKKGGKGTPARVHLIPINGRLSEVMAPLLALRGSDAPGPFTLRGSTPATSGTLQKIFSALGDSLSAAGRARKFTWLNVRVSVETHLASLGVNQERRAWLLSHGRSGVQAKCYDRYSYLPEKKQDLERWARYLDELATGEIAKVVRIRPTV